MKATPKLVCGVDEAGRGALAGPVVAAAVVLPNPCRICGLADSKALSPQQRAKLAELIKQRAQAWSVAQATPEEILSLNILRASLLAMRRAYESLCIKGGNIAIIVDGCFYPDGMPPGKAVKRGDALVEAVSAASILAKTHRDELMIQLQRSFPLYSFASHKGYPTLQHLRELEQHGPLPLHREAFAPVRKVIQARLGL